MFDPHDAAAYVRAQIRNLESRIREPEKTNDDARIALIATIGEKFPDVAKDKTLRHKIIMALLGKAITTQNELCWHETRILLEVLHDTDFDGSCWRALQVALESDFAGEPWKFPATRIL
jgi:hypothetical protein